MRSQSLAVPLLSIFWVGVVLPCFPLLSPPTRYLRDFNDTGVRELPSGRQDNQRTKNFLLNTSTAQAFAILRGTLLHPTSVVVNLQQRPNQNLTSLPIKLGHRSLVLSKTT